MTQHYPLSSCFLLKRATGYTSFDDEFYMQSTITFTIQCLVRKSYRLYRCLHPHLRFQRFLSCASWTSALSPCSWDATGLSSEIQKAGRIRGGRRKRNGYQLVDGGLKRGGLCYFGTMIRVVLTPQLPSNTYSILEYIIAIVLL